LRDAGELAGCSHHTVARYFERRAGGALDRASARPQLMDANLSKVEEWVERLGGKVSPDVAHETLGELGSRFRRAPRAARSQPPDGPSRAGYVRMHRPWVTEPGMWLQQDCGDGPSSTASRPCCS
jgi:hypothetical protein